MWPLSRPVVYLSSAILMADALKCAPFAVCCLREAPHQVVLPSLVLANVEDHPILIRVPSRRPLFIEMRHVDIASIFAGAESL